MLVYIWPVFWAFYSFLLLLFSLSIITPISYFLNYCIFKYTIVFDSVDISILFFFNSVWDIFVPLDLHVKCGICFLNSTKKILLLFLLKLLWISKANWPYHSTASYMNVAYPFSLFKSSLTSSNCVLYGTDFWNIVFLHLFLFFFNVLKLF